MAHKVEPLTDKERDWIASQLAAAGQFIDAFSPADIGQDLSLAALDRAFAAWLDAGDADNDRVNGTINCVGVAFGQILVSGTGLNWVISTDDNGSDLAVYGRRGSSEVIVFPANFVAKRWERRESSFLERAYSDIKAQVQAVKESPGKALTKPWWKFW